jgi:NitT/TauT family transport system substrate-binding protein
VKLAIPDMISNSYFPAIAAIELGLFKREGLDVELELIYPVDKSYAALREGAVDFVGGSAHSALSAFPRWQGAKLLCAQGQGMYWFLVMHRDLGGKRGDVEVVKGRRIGAAPWVDFGLRRLLIEAGIDLERDKVTIAPVPGAQGAGINFGVTAARALEERKIDGFWANGMGTEVAVRRGAGTVVMDVRRGDGPIDRHDRPIDQALAGCGRRRSPRPREHARGVEDGSCTCNGGGPKAFPAIRGRAHCRAHPSRSSLL